MVIFKNIHFTSPYLIRGKSFLAKILAEFKFNYGESFLRHKPIKNLIVKYATKLKKEHPDRNSNQIAQAIDKIIRQTPLGELRLKIINPPLTSQRPFSIIEERLLIARAQARQNLGPEWIPFSRGFIKASLEIRLTFGLSMFTELSISSYFIGEKRDREFEQKEMVVTKSIRSLSRLIETSTVEGSPLWRKVKDVDKIFYSPLKEQKSRLCGF